MSLEVLLLKAVDHCALGRRFYFVTYREVSFQTEEVLEQMRVTAGCVAKPVYYNENRFPCLWPSSQTSVAFYRGGPYYWYF